MSTDHDGGRAGLSRRQALALALTAVGSVTAGFFLRGPGAAEAAPLRPPGALAERDFLAACIRCLQCSSVCPNQCIQFEGLGSGVVRAYAPLIRPREQACVLCMKCTQACPTDALTPITDNPDAILASVRMGLAKVSEDLCYSYNGRMCGVCYYACPFPDKALRLKTYARPVVVKDACVGCGSCERACIHLPQAIRIAPKRA
ncbi:MAG: 4Fe-4S dicluster domain-containing protein [Rhodospirillales bacterium]